jgi:DinB superfamily
MKHDNDLRDHLVKVLTWHDAHVDFETTVQDVPPSIRAVRPESMPYSLWELLEHLRLSQLDILDFCRDPAYKAANWPEDYWPGAVASPKPESWDQSISDFLKDRKDLCDLISNPSIDLFSEIPHGDGQTYLREALLAADHAAYHIGEMVAVRRMLGAWKS